MRGDPSPLTQHLEALRASARAGQRLPTVRALMAQFSLSQGVVQRAIHALSETGQVQVEAGRGAYFTQDGERAEPRAQGDGAAALAPHAAGRARSVLIMRRTVQIDRGRYFAEQLTRRLTAEGHRVLEVGFSDAADAMQVLRGLSRLDACVVQSVYRGIPSELLALLQDKCRVVMFDGISTVSEGMDSIGTEWGEPLAQATDLLVSRGHRHLCFAATDQPLLATTLGFRRWAHLQQQFPGLSLETIRLPMLADEGYQEALVGALIERRVGARLPFTGLVAWGVSDGQRMRALLQDAGIAVPAALSMVLLGRTDQPAEHGDHFDIVGPRIADQVDLMISAIHARWADPKRPFGAYLAPVTCRAGASVAAPAG
ncbi:MAG: GntR family transcriptional regulator [Rhodoferax sp.]